MRFTLVQSIFASVIISLFTQAACAAAEPDKPMNVLLLIVDDLNTWLLEDPTRYSGKVVAPNIQRLAKEGVLFHNAYTASPVCSPSRTAFLSGVAPWKSGVSRNGVQVGDSKVLQGVPSLFRTFQDQGYWIGSFGKVSHGYDTGVKYDATMNHKRTPPPPGAPLNGIAQSAGGKLTERDWGATHLDENDMSDKRLADAAIKALQRKHDKPFFIACGLFHPHYPWYVPQTYLDMYPLDEIELPPIKADDLNDVPDYGQRLVDLGWDGQVKDKGLVKEAIRGYLASVTFSDAHMGRVLKALDESPHRDNTIVILISDHGFHLGEKQHWSKGTLWEEATDSVMMWRVPGVTQSNQICTRPVSLLDIYPTLVDLNGIEKPNHLDGHSLLPLLKDAAAPRSQPAITVYDGHISVRTETARFIRYWDGTTELYDRTKDPHEWTNQTKNPEFAALKTKLAGLLPARKDIVEPLPSRQAGAVNSTPREPKPPVPLFQKAESPSCVNKNSGFDSGLTDWQVYKGPGIEDSAKVEIRERSNGFNSRHAFIRLPSNSKDNPTQYVKIGQYLTLNKSRRYRYTVDVKWLNTENSLKSAIVSVWVREQKNGTFAGQDVWLRNGTKQTLTFDFSPTVDGIVDCYLSLLTHQDGFDNTDILIDDFKIEDVGPLILDEDPRPQENLIVNGNFEEGLKSWHETTNNPHRVTGLEKRATNVGTNNVLELELPGSEDPDFLNDTWIGLYQPVKLYSGNTYTISAKVGRLVPSRTEYPTIVNLYAVKSKTEGESAHWLGSVDYKFNRSDSHVYSQQFTPLVTGEYHMTIRVFGWGNKGRPLKVQFDNVVLRRE